MYHQYMQSVVAMVCQVANFAPSPTCAGLEVTPPPPTTNNITHNHETEPSDERNTQKAWTACCKMMSNLHIKLQTTARQWRDQNVLRGVHHGVVGARQVLEPCRRRVSGLLVWRRRWKRDCWYFNLGVGARLHDLGKISATNKKGNIFLKRIGTSYWLCSAMLYAHEDLTNLNET